MRLGTDYMQFSKALAIAMLLAYIVQIAATFTAICLNVSLADPLLQLMSSALAFYSIVYGCYAGNSAVEKAVNARQTAIKPENG